MVGYNDLWGNINEYYTIYDNCTVNKDNYWILSVSYTYIPSKSESYMINI